MSRAHRAVVVCAVAVFVSMFFVIGHASAAIVLEVSSDDTSYSAPLTLTPSGAGVYTYHADTLSIGEVNYSIDVTVTTNSRGFDELASLATELSVDRLGTGNDNSDVYFRVTDNMFTQPVGASQFLSNTLTGNAVSVVGTVLLSHDFATTLATVTGTADNYLFENSSPFALRNVTHINLDPGGISNTTSTTKIDAPDAIELPAVPEPSTLALWSIGLGIVGLIRAAKHKARAGNLVLEFVSWSNRIRTSCWLAESRSRMS